MQIEIGKLNKRIEIQSLTQSQDSYGDVIKVWSTDSYRWAAIEPVSGTEVNNADQIVATTTHKITMRYLPLNGINRIKYQNRIFKIFSKLNVEENGEELIVLATEQNVIKTVVEMETGINVTGSLAGGVEIAD